MTRYRAIRDGGAVTLGVGVVGTIVPLLGALAGAVAGGMLAGMRSSDDQRLANGLVATGLGAAVPMHTALLLFPGFGAGDAAAFTIPWLRTVLATVTPTALGGAAALGVVGALVARFATGSSGVDPKARDGTGGTWK